MKNQSKAEPNIETVELSVIDPHIKKNRQVNAESSIKKSQQGNADKKINKNQQGNTDTSIKKSRPAHPDTSVKKSQQAYTDTSVKKSQQVITDTSIKGSQQANTDTSIKKSQQANTTDTTIQKSQLGNADLNVKNIQQNSTDPNVKRTLSQTKLSKITARKQQQLKKLEEIVHKYNEKSEKTNDDLKKSSRTACDKSQIPIPNQLKGKKTKKVLNASEIDQLISEDIQDMNSSDISTEKVKIDSVKTSSGGSAMNKKHKADKNNRKINLVKEISMSLDSLEDCPTATGTNQNRNCQSIGINTLSCVACVIHDNPDKKKAYKKTKSNKDTKSGKEFENNMISEPKVELLYKNPIISNSLERGYDRDPYIIDHSANSNFDNTIVTPSTSENFIPDEIEPITDFIPDEIEAITDFIPDENEAITDFIPDEIEAITDFIPDETEAITDFDNQNIIDNNFNLYIEEGVDIQISNQNITESNRDSISEKLEEDNHSLTEENYDRESVELSCDSIENKFDDDNIAESNEIECRHGSGETYTKFTEDPADLEEFMNITDKLLSNDLSERECSNIAKGINSLHTPTANSIEAINQQVSDDAISEPPKHQFSDTFQDLKDHLRELLEGAGNSVSQVLKKTEDIDKDTTSNNTSDVSKNVRDMEHITVYQLQFYEKTAESDERKDADEEPPRLKLPSISESNKPGDKVERNKKKMKNIYKPKKKFKMLGEQTRFNKEYQTFIVNQNSNENSDGQSETSEPALKLPRIENKRLDYLFAHFLFFHFSSTTVHILFSCMCLFVAIIMYVFRSV